MNEVISQSEHNEYIINELTRDPSLLFDKEWRIENLYWIMTKNLRKQVFKMNKAQRHFFDNYLNLDNPYLRHTILKSRQLGFTTFIQLWMLDEILFNKDREAIGIAHIQKEAIQIFDRKIDFPLKNLSPDVKDLMFKIVQNSARKIQIEFTDDEDSKSISAISVSNSGRSGTFHYAHISEYAPLCVTFPKRAEEVKLGTFPAVPRNGYIFIESTAETMADDFYVMFNQEWFKRDKIDADDTQYRFMPHFYNWTWDEDEINTIRKVIPVEDMEECVEINWAEYKMINELTDIQITYYYMKWLEFGKDVRKLNQQYPTVPEEAFLASGQTYFPARLVNEYKRKSEKGERFDILNGQLFPSSNGDLEIFKKPERGHFYIIGGDTAEGLSHGDGQVMTVVDAMTEEIVALFKSQMSADEYPDTAIALAKYYNNALLGIESNFEGRWINSSIIKKGYENVYFKESFDDITRSMTKSYGWLTSGGKNGSRGFALMSLKEQILRRDEKKYPMALLEEMDSFVFDQKGKPQALSGKHDDCIMSAAIAYGILFQRGKQTQVVSNEKGETLMDTIWGRGDSVVFYQN